MDSVPAEAVTAAVMQPPASLMFAESPAPDMPQKLKGRQRLLASFQRMSSSSSVTRLNPSRSRSYNGLGKGSVSCISLHSTSTYGPALGQSLTGDFAAGNAAAASSSALAPGIQIRPFDENARLRYTSGEGKSSVGLPADMRSAAKAQLTPGPPIHEVNEDYFSRPVAQAARPKRKDFNFWRDLPSELKMEVLTYLQPKEIVRSSVVSTSFHKMCFDGQLWACLDTSGFYQDIPSTALIRIITAAGPFVRDLNLRGCAQLKDRWSDHGLSRACTNLENFTLEGCRIDRASINNFLESNARLVNVNLSGLAGATNHAMSIVAANCPKLQYLNVSWCTKITTRGLHKVVQACAGLRDLRAGEITGWDDVEFMEELFQRNTLERLILMNCDSLTDESLAVLIEGSHTEVDWLTGRRVAPPRRLKHLDLTRCRRITDDGVRCLVNNIPAIQGLQLSKCHGILDATICDLLRTTPVLTHLDLEELDELSNAVLQSLAASPCAKRLRHLSISYCENMGDAGMLPVLKACTNLRSLEMDNTRIGDLVLTEAASMVRLRAPRTTIVQGSAQAVKPLWKPATGLRLVAYDCQNVTWTGIREVLSRNAETTCITHTTQLPPLEKSAAASAASSHEHLPPSAPAPPSPPLTPRIHIVRSHTFPTEVIHMKCFYTYQPTVEEHTKRVMQGDFTAARRLERKWADFMMAQEEAGAAGAGSRRRRRRAREAQMMHADEEDVHASGSGVGGGRRRRARSGGCALM